MTKVSRPQPMSSSPSRLREDFDIALRYVRDWLGRQELADLMGEYGADCDRQAVARGRPTSSFLREFGAIKPSRLPAFTIHPTLRAYLRLRAMLEPDLDSLASLGHEFKCGTIHGASACEFTLNLIEHALATWFELGVGADGVDARFRIFVAGAPTEISFEQLSSIQWNESAVADALGELDVPWRHLESMLRAELSGLGSIPQTLVATISARASRNGHRIALMLRGSTIEIRGPALCALFHQVVTSAPDSLGWEELHKSVAASWGSWLNRFDLRPEDVTWHPAPGAVGIHYGAGEKRRDVNGLVRQGRDIRKLLGPLAGFWDQGGESVAWSGPPISFEASRPGGTG